MSASETTYFAAPQIDPQLLTNTYWKTLQPKQKRTDTSISVIIPVYKNMQLTLECIHSVLTSNNKTPFELIVINDHSPDHTLSRKLQELSNLGLFTLLTNKKNLGFVKTVNLGMRENIKTDVVLLNSDTRVFHDWLDRLKKAATQNNIASVTPLSNNATICSYPTFLQDNDNPAETLPHEIDLLAKAHNSAYIEAPTGVGFCMYITRAALNAVGLFDAESFGKGYGEENDWCQRSIAQGLKNLITTDTYVWHHGGASFQGAQKKLIQRAMKTLNSLHPNYHKDVHAFIKADPLFTARQTLDIYRLKAFSRQENALIVVHNRGGGTARNVHESITQLQNKGVGTFILQPHSKLSEYICISHPKCKDLPNLESLSFSNLQPLKEILLTLHITSIHVHSTLDFKDGASDSISELARIMNIDLNIVIHDYESICPRVNLVGTDGKYCGEKSISQCAQCLSTSEDDIIARRQRYDRLLTSAARVYAPSQDAANRVQRYFPKANIQYMAHSEIEIATKEPAITARAATSTLKVLVIGALSSIKGYDVLLHCARFAKTHSTPLQFYLMGYSINDKLLEDAGVVITGKYLEPDADYLFSTIAPDAVLLPSIWPETYSYTLSLGLRHGCPIFAFDIGAIPERLKKSDLHDGIMPLEWSNNPEKVINYITACLNNLHQKNYSLN